jgi:hypothetical protein
MKGSASSACSSEGCDRGLLALNVKPLNKPSNRMTSSSPLLFRKGGRILQEQEAADSCVLTPVSLLCAYALAPWHFSAAIEVPHYVSLLASMPYCPMLFVQGWKMIFPMLLRSLACCWTQHQLLLLLHTCWWFIQWSCSIPFQYVVEIGDILPHGDHELSGNDRRQKMAGCAGTAIQTWCEDTAHHVLRGYMYARTVGRECK